MLHTLIVTFFLNGGVEEPMIGEDRILVPSPDVATYDLQPEMNAPALTNKLVEAIESEVRNKTFNPVVINSDRGRGKSAAIGIAAARLVESGVKNHRYEYGTQRISFFILI